MHSDDQKPVTTVVHLDDVREAKPELMDETAVKGVLVTLADAYDAPEMDIQDVHDFASSYPPEEVDPNEPVSEIALLLAGVLVSLYHNDRDVYSLAVSSALKDITYRSDLKKFNQDAHGRNADAMARLEATHGAAPNRMAYRMRMATKMDRFWTWGRDIWTHKKLRWFFPGPRTVITDPSFWHIHRSCWHCTRVVNGILSTTARPDIPCDAYPEKTLGDDWRIVENMPTLRVQQPGKGTIKNDIDLLHAALGFRSRGNMTFQEMIYHMTVGSQPESRTIKSDDDGEPSLTRRTFTFILKAVGVLSVMAGVPAALIFFA